MSMEIGIQQLFKLLSDETRLRILLLLEAEELAVQELVSITGLGQSTVSHHLSLLRSAGLLRDRKDGTWTFVSLVPADAPGAMPKETWKLIRSFESSDPAKSDREALPAVLAERHERSRQAHDRLAGVWRLVGQDLERGSLRSEALAALATPDLTVADLGCGAGFFTHYLAPRVARVIAIDQSAAMLHEARLHEVSSAAGAGVSPTRVEYRQGALDALPIEDSEVDAVLANLVLHHIVDFEPVVREMARILKPGGVAVITDLRPHREEWMREEMADLRLGIEASELLQTFEREAFESVEELPVEDRYRMKSRGGRSARLELFMIRAVRGAGASSRQKKNKSARKQSKESGDASLVSRAVSAQK